MHKIGQGVPRTTAQSYDRKQHNSRNCDSRNERVLPHSHRATGERNTNAQTKNKNKNRNSHGNQKSKTLPVQWAMSGYGTAAETPRYRPTSTAYLLIPRGVRHMAARSIIRLALEAWSSRLRASERVSPAIGCNGGAGGRYNDAPVVPEAYDDDVTSCGFCVSSSSSSSPRSNASSPPRCGSRSSCQWWSSAYHTTTLYTAIPSSTVVSSSTIPAYALAPPSLGARWFAALTRHSAARSTKLAVRITVRKAERIMFVKATTPAPASSTAAMQKYWTWQPPTGGCTAAIRDTTHSTDSWNTHQYT
ncbi:hypothetical protein ECC02_006564 [Trypanosoma cruzi]|uniref:Uncharacterized protein n=1 Tax=Trypanosoma cruzi TaxID=5693 RepID=A0A7J6Y295_TRYCR|nr:hypothetical protein ECC02_006564 [Trypanosoma cruzi]